MPYSKLISLGLILLLFGCGQPSSDKLTLQATGQPKYVNSYVDKVGEQLLYSLSTNAVSRNEVRLWVDYSIMTTVELFTLRDFDSTTYLTKYRCQRYGILSGSHFDSVRVEIESPTVSAKFLTRRLYSLNFRDLISQPDSISQMIGDGIIYTLEVRDSTYYKTISYNVPHEFPDSNHQNFMRIIGELEKAMNWRYEMW